MRSVRKLLPLVALLVAVISAYPAASSLSKAVRPQPQSVNLVLGNPSDATADFGDKDNFLMIKPQFVLSFNNSKGGANWVAWHLQLSDIGKVGRGSLQA